MKSLIVTILMLVCIAFGAALVWYAEWHDAIVFSPSDGLVADSRSVRAHLSFSSPSVRAPVPLSPSDIMGPGQLYVQEVR